MHLKSKYSYATDFRSIGRLRILMILMSLEEEMMNELRKMERQMTGIDVELSKLQARVTSLTTTRDKLHKDTEALRFYFYPSERKQKQMTLAGLMK